ncbi:MAG: hypothetical protein CAPSK01_001166 [Candidatus Accumulibacter vicinus]|uniref:Uncharacterized protein n=1 Tax=Candidatus Accumulibacter vicinus TaxID=2954382 RepID=A0A084Y2N3_9PROT|nr:MAG: hypothetical protein CAPSK01_001166 [Candidatus Accumulibacter vicinus]
MKFPFCHLDRIHSTNIRNSEIQEFGVCGAIRFIRIDPAQMRVLLTEPFLLQLESLCRC